MWGGRGDHHHLLQQPHPSMDPAPFTPGQGSSWWQPSPSLAQISLGNGALWGTPGQCHPALLPPRDSLCYGVTAPCKDGKHCPRLGLPTTHTLPSWKIFLAPPAQDPPPSPSSISLISANGKWAPSLLGKLPGGCRAGKGYKLSLESLRGGGRWYPPVLDLSLPALQSSARGWEQCQASATPQPVPFPPPRDRAVSAPANAQQRGAQHL